MDILYKIMEMLLPFRWVEYDFMKNALLAILIITPLFGILGTMIVNNRMAFFSDALGHSALTGIAIGTLFGITDSNIAMLLFAAFFALILNRIKRKKTVSTDTVISVFASLSMALGLVILSRGGNFAKYSGLLVGDILSIKRYEIALLCISLLITITFWVFCFNQLQAISVNESLAKSKKIRIQLIEDLFSIIIAMIVMSSVKWVGILIINALLILPAAASRNISSNQREYHLFSVLISLFSGISGLIISYYIGTATGPTVVIIAAIIFFITLFARPQVS
ncbi:metal ABC transporter permease [Lachnospiraceae bacterium MD1]|jgi:zinc transport system permease protein|uniref:Metal ABC transporter permease n=1 Tax=Variimorphobacter saccharofermentans TaxID=2755051 RepID=A0A839JXE6_9FIRM|nr:metal ABC transporter permease [Variimorphobacter saccharofermentans]MBB2181964.1 metal ABC transporter permease [Variimorphobacter saccharofermentans]